MSSVEARVLPDPSRHESALVARMFTDISPTYDRLNHLLSLNVDRWWRRCAVKAMAPENGGIYLDLCTGTGDLGFALLKRAKARVIGLDFSEGMLNLAAGKGAGGKTFPLLRADSLALPLKDSSVDGVMVAFGVRNFEDLQKGIGEAARVLRTGGKLVILELSKPDGGLHGALFNFYFKVLLPLIGRMISGTGGAYRYLPESVESFPAATELHAIIENHPMKVYRYRALTGGIAGLHCAVKEG